MKKIFRLSLLLIFTLPAFMFSSKTLIFVVDVSGSMKQSGIYKPVINSLITFIDNEFEERDNLILCSFGTTFYRNYEVFSATRTQMKGFLPYIERLNFRDDWTYMTLAFKEVAELVDILRQRYPNNPIYIYFYTDGQNEPPPYVSNPLTFDQIIKWYFGSYKNPQTHLYIVTLGVKPDPGLDSIADTTGASIIEVPGPINDTVPVPTTKPELRPIEITPQKISFKTSSKTGKIETGIKFTNNNDLGKIKIKVSIDNFKISPEEITLDKGEDSVRITIEYKDLAVKTHRAALTFSSQNPDIKFNPDKIYVEITIYSLLPWFILGILFLVILIFLLRCLSIPKFPRAYLVHLDESGNVVKRFNLRSHQKFCSNRLKISDDLNVRGIMNGSLELIAESGGAIALKVLAKGKALRLLATDSELKTGEKQQLSPDDEFEFNGVRLKYEKGG